MNSKVHFHLPGLFEYDQLYSIFLPLYFNHPEYFYEWSDIASIYGSPSDCLWGGGRTSFGHNDINSTIKLLEQYGISGRLTFSNSLLAPEHLKDKKCNQLCKNFFEAAKIKTGIIIHSDLLLKYLSEKYPSFYYVSSTTKVITDFEEYKKECAKAEFTYVVPDFRFNNDFNKLKTLSTEAKNKTEFLVNECCNPECSQRKICYENVSKKNLGISVQDHKCTAPHAENGYVFSSAMLSPLFIDLDSIKNKYIPLGFTNFKIEGRGLGSAIILEFLLYYLTKPEYQLKVREAIYLDSMLDLF